MRGFWALKRSLEGQLELGEEKKIEEEKNETDEYGGAEADILAVREKHCVYCVCCLERYLQNFAFGFSFPV